MKGKLLFVAGLGVGYVLGARAGRKRYEQMAAGARRVWQSPGIQKQVHQVQDLAADTVGDIPGALIDAGKKVVASVTAARKDAASASRPASRTATTPSFTASGSSAAEAAATTAGEAAAASADDLGTVKDGE
jgi:hypothetical protein